MAVPNWMGRLGDVLYFLAREHRPLELFAHDRSAVRRLRAGTSDLYAELEQATGASLRLVTDRLGEPMVAEARRLSRDYVVTADDARAYLHFMRTLRVNNSYEALVAAKNQARIGRLFEADHIVEVRILRTLRDGAPGATARSWEHAVPGDAQDAVHRALGAMSWANKEAMDDALAVLAPANHVVAIRLARIMPSVAQLPTAAPWYFVHQGALSKTARMNWFIPWRMEGMYSIQQTLEATLWVVCHENALPKRAFEDAIRGQIFDSVIHAMEHDDATMVILSEVLGLSRRRVPSPEAMFEALEAFVPKRPLTASMFAPDAWPHVPSILGEGIDQAWEAEVAADAIVAR